MKNLFYVRQQSQKRNVNITMLMSFFVTSADQKYDFLVNLKHTDFGERTPTL